MVSNTISREKIGSAYGLTSAVTCFGIGMGPFLGGIMASLFGLRLPFAVIGIFAFLIAVVVNKKIDYRDNNISNNELTI